MTMIPEAVAHLTEQLSVAAEKDGHTSTQRVSGSYFGPATTEVIQETAEVVAGAVVLLERARSLETWLVETLYMDAEEFACLDVEATMSAYLLHRAGSTH